jgi:hypothetical protein
MIKFYKIYFLALSLLIFSSLHALAQISKNFKINDFSEKVELKGEKLRITDELLNPGNLLLIDSLLIIQNLKTSPAFDVVNFKTGKIIGRFCSRGRGPGELVAPFVFQYIDETREIMVQDIQGKKLVFFGLDLVLKNAAVKYTRTVTLDNEILVRKINMVHNGNFFCDLIGHEDGYMNCLIDSNGKLVRFLNKYPKTDFQFNPVVGSNIFNFHIGTTSDRKHIITPASFSDRIDIYNVDGKTITHITGPNFKKPDVARGANGVSLTGKNNQAYSIPSANNNSFMVPYKGSPYRITDPHSHTKQLFWIGLNGDLLKHFEVSPSVSRIAVDWEKRIIYGLNAEMEPAIYMYKY